jgi:hypothetical protein
MTDQEDDLELQEVVCDDEMAVELDVMMKK